MKCIEHCNIARELEIATNKLNRLSNENASLINQLKQQSQIIGKLSESFFEIYLFSLINNEKTAI